MLNYELVENRIRHILVINDKKMIGMVSIGDVVRTVVSEYREEPNRLNAYMQRYFIFFQDTKGLLDKYECLHTRWFRM
ncbi:hypothetical protein Sjap_003961 [Stephania japonica]|uniref:CBS domain-containing protein n=1 Tax=Stephania japonica TaxID=461633 RepID=A0AAP0K1E4_9MAGN